jgi:hypothetical protein
MNWMKSKNMRCGALLVLACGLFTASATAQVPRIDDLPDGHAPLALEGGARWLHNALLAPLMKRPAPPAKPARELVAPEVKELSGVYEKIGSPLKGSSLESVGEPIDPAERQRIWEEMTKRWRAEEATTTQRVSDETGPEYSSMPVFDPYQQPIDAMQAAIEQLRASARNLDLAAANLEDAGKYAAADRLRSTAQRLRREAREFAAVPEKPVQEAAITR